MQALGFNELSYGPEGLLHLLKKATFPILSANIDTSKEPSVHGKIKPSTVLTVGGEKIGIIGYTTQDAAEYALPGTLN